MGKKILIIDDEPNIAKMIGSRLQANGYDIETAENGEDGLKKVESASPDLIILDVLMPVMDGFEFFKNIKKDPEKSQVPVIVLTGRGGMKDTFEAMDADEFVSKPFDATDLVTKVEACLTKKALLYFKDAVTASKITTELEKRKCEVHVVENEEDFVKKGGETKFKLIIVHLALVEKEPGDFIIEVNGFKSRSDKLVIFCDSMVKGTEDGNTVAINEIKTGWDRAGLESFYDSRISDVPITAVIANFIK